MRQTTITPLFVDLIPDRLEEGIFYISEKYAIIIHKCCCGCGEEIVTPLSPVDWQIRKNGNTITLMPSIGNWNYPCQSHYCIRRNIVEWAGRMTKQQISRVQDRDRKDKERYVAKINAQKVTKSECQLMVEKVEKVEYEPIEQSWLYGLWCALKNWWGR